MIKWQKAIKKIVKKIKTDKIYSHAIQHHHLIMYTSTGYSQLLNNKHSKVCVYHLNLQEHLSSYFRLCYPAILHSTLSSIILLTILSTILNLILSNIIISTILSATLHFIHQKPLNSVTPRIRWRNRRKLESHIITNEPIKLRGLLQQAPTVLL